MEIYISIDSAGYVDGYSYSEINPGKKIQISEGDLFFQRMFTCYKFESGKIVYDAKKEADIIQEAQIKDAMPSASEQLISTQMALTDMYEQNNNLQQQLGDVYEQNNNLQQQLLETQLAITEIFEGGL
ncbi:hypothetical protein ACW2R7_002019 [Listeria monocytogenes]|uniref:hypothetical protein n=1 Tax=Listeria TaxID=1637 RepID=UPI0007669F8A|nr:MULTISPECIES: hypothetical protein [Listeria]EAC9467725.1 hypothetical protein [Listeria monocytogenes]EAD0460557.1 hypothetical protein [Listeria monocytogenes]EAD6997233.1 hypothetical protein [Listeria monocytogenes]EAD9986468.1 hypothetical protein [Listeria monocytogenes]EAE4847980.1 hypothetical protein [Listeria monocytogenes]